MPDVQTVPPKLTRSAALDQLAAFFEDQRDGECAVELAEALAHVAKEVRAHNKSGSVSLTIRLTPIGKVDAALEVADDIKAKAPQQPKSASILFVDSRGELGKEHPTQRTLPGVARTPLQHAKTSAVGFDDPVELGKRMTQDLREQGHEVTVTVTPGDTLPAGVDPATGEVTDPPEHRTADGRQTVEPA